MYLAGSAKDKQIASFEKQRRTGTTGVHRNRAISLRKPSIGTSRTLPAPNFGASVVKRFPGGH